MGVYGGPNIVEDGLVLALDSGNYFKSYPVKNIVGAKIYSVYGSGLRSSNYSVQYSDDNSNWTTAFSGVASNNTSCGIQQNTGNGDGSYGFHRYWRYVEGSAIVGHHPRVSRIILTDIKGIDYDYKVYTTDNCVDSGAYQLGTVNSFDFGGTTWTDLSGNGNNGTLVNGVGFTVDDGGSLEFDGVNDYVISNVTTDTRNKTYSIWCIVPTSGEQQVFSIGNASYTTIGLTFNSNREGNSQAVATSGLYGVASNTGSYGLASGLEVESFHNFTLTTDSSGNLTALYINGQSQPSRTQLSRVWIYEETFRLSIRGDNNYPYSKKIAQALIYNRALTAQEIQQNFIATRSRFGI